MGMFTDETLFVLEALPKEPIAHSVPDLALDLFGQSDSKAQARVRHALSELIEFTYVDSANTRPYGYKDRYGIRADRWGEVQKLFQNLS